MREILFRGKRVDNGEWIYGDFFQDEDTGLYMINLIDVITETVGQYTGLNDKNDKNGTKIFEGDIIWGDDCSGTWHKGIVEYDDNLGCFIVNAQNFMQYPKNEDCYCLFGHWCVEGNIHDNPELLKGGVSDA